jgi:hypothetical protein
MRSEREYHEGPDAADRFEDTLRRVLKVSKEELLKREAAYKKARKAAKAHKTAGRTR